MYIVLEHTLILNCSETIRYDIMGKIKNIKNRGKEHPVNRNICHANICEYLA